MLTVGKRLSNLLAIYAGNPIDNHHWIVPDDSAPEGVRIVIEDPVRYPLDWHDPFRAEGFEAEEEGVSIKVRNQITGNISVSEEAFNAAHWSLYVKATYRQVGDMEIEPMGECIIVFDGDPIVAALHLNVPKDDFFAAAEDDGWSKAEIAVAGFRWSPGDGMHRRVAMPRGGI